MILVLGNYDELWTELFVFHGIGHLMGAAM